MENQISAKLSRAAAYSNSSFAMQPTSAGNGGTAHDLFEQFLVMPTQQAPAEGPDARESTGEEEPREPSTDNDRESRTENDGNKSNSAESVVESNDSDDAVDPLLLTDSLAPQELSTEQAENTDIPLSVPNDDLHHFDSDHASTEKIIVPTTGEGEHVTVDTSLRPEPIADSHAYLSVEQGEAATAPQQTAEAQESGAVTSRATASDEASATFQGEQELSHDESQDPVNRSQTTESRATSAATQRDSQHTDQQASEQVFEAQTGDAVDSSEGEEPEAKWFQQTAANPLYSVSQTGESPVSLPPVDASPSEQPINSLPPDLEGLVEPATDTNPLQENVANRPQDQGNESGAVGKKLIDSQPHNVPVAKAAAQTAIPASTTSSSQTDGTNSVNNSSLRPDTNGPVRNTGTNVTPGSPNTEANDINQHERIRLIQRVSRSFSRLTPTGGEISLRLHPPQLGSLAVKVQMEGSSLSARLSTETEAAREIIMESLPVLRKRLAEQGIEVTQMHVDVSDSSSDSSLAGSGGDGSAQEQPAERKAQQRAAQLRQAVTARSAPIAQSPTVTSTPSTPQGWVAATSIDVHA